tara:strand:- start:349 stop:792 length:444 start_codon:yes stop_codon:yes gene_type:complete
MKKSAFLLGVLFITLSYNSFSQKHLNHYYGNHHDSHHHNLFDYHDNHHNLFGGILTDILLHELLGSISTNYRQMYFKYKPYKDTWQLQRDVVKHNSIFYGNNRVIAKFENPRGGRDFLVTINKRGQWELDCPKKLAKLFKNKVRKNL